MADDPPDRDQKTEAPTAKKKRQAVEQGDVLQSRELGIALVMLAGAGWLALAGPWFMESLRRMLANALSFNAGAVENFDPLTAMLNMLAAIALPIAVLFLLTTLAAIGAPALLGSLGFRWGSIGFKASKLNPAAGFSKMFGMNGLVELGKSMLKIVVLGTIGYWLLAGEIDHLVVLGHQDLVAALGELGSTFVYAVLIMSLGLALIAGIDVPAQMLQRTNRLKMTKQEIRDESKETEGSPELKAAIRQRQMQVLRGSARTAIVEATVVLTNPTHFAVALRYRPGFDAAPIVVARGRGATAQAIRELASESQVPVLHYPQLTRAIYYTSRAGQMVRDDLFVAVAAVLAFVFNLDRAMAEGYVQPDVDVPTAARFDEEGKPSA